MEGIFVVKTLSKVQEDKQLSKVLHMSKPADDPLAEVLEAKAEALYVGLFEQAVDVLTSETRRVGQGRHYSTDSRIQVGGDVFSAHIGWKVGRVKARGSYVIWGSAMSNAKRASFIQRLESAKRVHALAQVYA